MSFLFFPRTTLDEGMATKEFIGAAPEDPHTLKSSISFINSKGI